MLKKSFIAALLVCGAVVSFAAVQDFKVDRFQKIKVTGPLDVDCVYCPDSVGVIRVDAPIAGQMPWVDAQVKGDKLLLRLVLPDNVRMGEAPVSAELPSVRVYTNYLTSVENEGDSTVRVMTATNVPTFKAVLIGNGRLSVRGIDAEKVDAKVIAGRGIMALNGKADEAKYHITGVGTIQADGLQAREAKVHNTGTGAVGVYATEKLKVTGIGSGSVYVKGSPEVTKRAPGLKLQPIE
ncbi:MAG: DUF2807 domain-containing protein [Bacteroides sp.]|nr:DUF2807 domain-containing protein [Bacteroides sp.]MCM1378786.1 DUF2807 domain-containing protein [Bacteroides sp.]MCM1445403.1 DUF2807 domain-containing protein [Prevotella sp.]